ncbi:MAG: hypothetical protein KIT34_17650 [Cyanobacteria bacterium TGS_CYA1]|nr:hypothetical protein [Cyanobacteria bacterium TGS_CYA1]
MGWKCGCVFIGSIEDGYFSTKPLHQPELALSIHKALRGEPRTAGSPHYFDIWPDQGKVVIGAYEKGAFVADQNFGDLLERGEYDLFDSVSAFYKAKDYLALALHSVVNYAAFAYCKNGTLKRGFACSADSGIILQVGEILPEETKQYANSYERDGETIFTCVIRDKIEEFTIDCIAEEMVFDLAARPLGKRLDEFDENNLQTELFLPGEKKNKDSSTGKPQISQRPFWKFW